MKKRRLFFVPLFALLGLVAALYRPEIPPEELEARYADGASRFVELEGSRVHYRDEGPTDAPAVLLLHGTAASLHTWDAWTERLLEEYRVLRLDLQGFGLTGPNDARDYSLERQVRVIAAFLDHRGVETVDAAGNSLGGLIAWRLALAHPERVRKLVLVDPAGAPRPPEPETKGDDGGFRVIDLARIPVLNTLMSRLTPRFLVRRALEQVYGDPSRLTEETVDRYYRLLLRRGNRQALQDAMTSRRPSGGAASRDRPTPADLTQPTLILWGSEDTWIPPSDGPRFARVIPESYLVVYEGLGHVPMEEEPETVREALEFLRGDMPLTESRVVTFENGASQK